MLPLLSCSLGNCLLWIRSKQSISTLHLRSRTWLKVICYVFDWLLILLILASLLLILVWLLILLLLELLLIVIAHILIVVLETLKSYIGMACQTESQIVVEQLLRIVEVTALLLGLINVQLASKRYSHYLNNAFSRHQPRSSNSGWAKILDVSISGMVLTCINRLQISQARGNILLENS